MYDNLISQSVPLEKFDTVPIYRSDGKVIIGKVVGQVFYKTVKGSRHMLRTPPAWAIDKTSLEKAKQAGAITIEIKDSESGAIFQCSISQLEHFGFMFDRGFGAQIGLVLEKWVKIKEGKQETRQLPTFGGEA